MPGKPQAGKPAQHGDVALQAPIRRAHEHAPDQAGPGLAQGAWLGPRPARAAAIIALSCRGTRWSGMSPSRVLQKWHGGTAPQAGVLPRRAECWRGWLLLTQRCRHQRLPAGPAADRASCCGQAQVSEGLSHAVQAVNLDATQCRLPGAADTDESSSAPARMLS